MMEGTASLSPGSMSVHARRRGLFDEDEAQRQALARVTVIQHGTAIVFYLSAGWHSSSRMRPNTSGCC